MARKRQEAKRKRQKAKEVELDLRGFENLGGLESSPPQHFLKILGS
jgi:hypothetical protein